MIFGDRMRDAARSAGAATATGLRKIASTGKDGVQSRFDAIPAPSAPVSEPWELSLAGIIRRHNEVPSIAGKALGLLDRFGALRLGPTSVGFDDQDVDWARLLEVRTRPVAEVLTQTALDREIERIRKLLPPVPGRKWVLTKVGEALGDLAVAAMTGVNSDEPPRAVVSELVYRGSLGRTREMASGLIVTAILAAIPAVNESIVVTARSHRVAIVDAAAGPGASGLHGSDQ